MRKSAPRKSEKRKCRKSRSKAIPFEYRRQLKEDAEFELGCPEKEAVISVPAYSNDRQRAATRNAGLLADLEVERLINEPSAAALFFQLEHFEEDELFLVFDF